jgi:hypothetical protein
MKNYTIVLRGNGIKEEKVKSTKTLRGAKTIAKKIDTGGRYLVIVSKTGSEYFL